MKTLSLSRPHPASAKALEAASNGAENPRHFNSDDLFGEAQEIEIAHNGASYRLRKTSLGKLILTK